MYRFVFSARWIGLALLMVAASATMVGLGLWQLDRYHQRSEINSRIDSAATRPPQLITAVLAAPAHPSPGSVGAAPPAQNTWSRVIITGTYDSSHEIIARARTVDGRVGFEVVTPLRLTDGTAVLVDRGWIAPTDEGATQLPSVPAAPPGDVTVVGRVHAPESRANTPEPFAGRLAVRRIAPQKIAPALPYAVYGAFVTLESQTPPADKAFVAIAPDHENAAMNAGYVVQWWLLAALTLVGYVYLVIRERRSREVPEDLASESRLAEAPVSPAV